MNQIVKILVKRLEEEGIENTKIPNCVETIWNIFYLYPITSCEALNSHMQTMGWHNFKMDDHTFKLVRLMVN